MEVVEQIRVLPVSKPAAWRRINLQWMIVGICVAMVAYLALMPLGFLI